MIYKGINLEGYREYYEWRMRFTRLRTPEWDRYENIKFLLELNNIVV